MSVAWVILLTVATYAVLGLAFAVAFVTRGVARVDPTAANAPWRFRLIIAPGVVALWPWLLRRWTRAGVGGHSSAERAAHKPGAGT